jgi:hypothetical protein
MAIQQAPPRATGLPAADQGIQESVRDLHSHLERYAAHRPKSSAEFLIDCEEDRTLRDAAGRATADQGAAGTHAARRAGNEADPVANVPSVAFMIHDGGTIPFSPHDRHRR